MQTSKTMKVSLMLCVLFLNMALPGFAAEAKGGENEATVDEMTEEGLKAQAKREEELKTQSKGAAASDVKHDGTTDTKAEDTKAEDIKAEEPKSEEASTEHAVSDEVKGEMEEKKEEEEEEHEAPSGVRDPRPCEVCKYLAVELQGRLEETGKVKDYIETGHGIMPGDRKRKEYKKSELRFIEAVHEPHVCDKILDYDIHAERKRSLRYAKGSSETRRTLHWLRLKGVKVELGMPEEMWTRDAPPNEIHHLQRLCVEMVERYEEDIEDWYWGHQEERLYDYLCRHRALKTKDQECLEEEFVPEEHKEEEKDNEKQAALPDKSEAKGDPDAATTTPLPPSSSSSPGPNSPLSDNDSSSSTPTSGSDSMPNTPPPSTTKKDEL